MIWNETTYVKKHIEYKQLAASVSTTQLLARYLCVKRYPGMWYIYICCGCIGYRESCHAFAMNHLWVLNLEVVLCEITPQLGVLKRRAVLCKTTIASCVMKPCLQNVLTIMIYTCWFIHVLCFRFLWFTQTTKIFLQQQFSDLAPSRSENADHERYP